MINFFETNANIIVPILLGIHVLGILLSAVIAKVGYKHGYFDWVIDYDELIINTLVISFMCGMVFPFILLVEIYKEYKNNKR